MLTHKLARKLFITSVTGVVLAATFSSVDALADTSPTTEQVVTDSENQLYGKIAHCFSVNEDNYININTEALSKVSLSDSEAEFVSEVINFVKSTNKITPEIQSEHVSRALFPIGSYGNYCGWGNKGWKKKPKDNLDAACREHDKCYRWGKNNKKCNAAFLKRLDKIIKASKKNSVKQKYAKKALFLFKYILK